ncbi:hypothetical protein [Kluyvera georgiana]|uniref:hypothetical protein n=1 Tax=Kluyvera georgiana TaxID=73098 RepID=UPI003AF0C941
MATSKPHPVLYALAFVGFSGVCTIAAFCARVGAAQEQLAQVVTTQAKEGDTLATLVKYEAVDSAKIDSLEKQVDKMRDK